MTTTIEPTRKANHALSALVVVGLLALVGGGIVALLAKANAGRDQSVSDFTFALGGYGDSSAATADLGLMWFGIVLAILGALCLIVALIVREARPPVSTPLYV